jgi:DNA topoisomerase-1
VFDYIGKSGKHQQQAVRDDYSGAVVRALKRRRAGGEKLLAYREGRRWHDVRSEQISDYLKAQIGEEFRAKDFRTWNATVLAAVSLAVDGRDARTGRARKRAMDGAVRGVSAVLGNTPAVARRAYIDPRVFDRYQSGWTIGGEVERIGRLTGPDDRRRARLEAAVLDLLRDDRASPAVTHDGTQTRTAGRARAERPSRGGAPPESAHTLRRAPARW